MSSPQSKSNTDAVNVNQEDLRKELRELLQQVTRREPLEMNYKFLLMNGKVTHKKPTFPKDKLYKAMTANLRKKVEAFGTVHEWDRVSQRQQHEGEPFDEKSLRQAMTLREAKEHEQKPLLQATLEALNTPDVMARKDYVEGMALGLKSKELKASQKREESLPAVRNKQISSMIGDNQRKNRLDDQRKRHEALRRRRPPKLPNNNSNEEEGELRPNKKARQESPGNRLSRFLMPFFQKLWDMEFADLDNMNPFRIIIDRSNCAQMGAPDYFDVITKPMNLAWIKDKLKKGQYELKGFFDDVELMIKNCLDYNSDPNNDYHKAALEMRKSYKNLRRHIISIFRKKQAKK